MIRSFSSRRSPPGGYSGTDYAHTESSLEQQTGDRQTSSCAPKSASLQNRASLMLGLGCLDNFVGKIRGADIGYSPDSGGWYARLLEQKTRDDLAVEIAKPCDSKMQAEVWARGRGATLMPGRRKSVEPMAARIEQARVKAAHQSLRHLNRQSQLVG